MDRIGTYEEFWTYYLSEHSRPITKCWHLVGSSSGLTLIVVGILFGELLFTLPAALVVGYACAWVGHFKYQRNKPATFKYPLWSFYSDFRMSYLLLTGKLDLDAGK